MGKIGENLGVPIKKKHSLYLVSNLLRVPLARIKSLSDNFNIFLAYSDILRITII